MKLDTSTQFHTTLKCGKYLFIQSTNYVTNEVKRDGDGLVHRSKLWFRDKQNMNLAD